jgi:hypothetical protein
MGKEAESEVQQEQVVNKQQPLPPPPTSSRQNYERSGSRQRSNGKNVKSM